MPTLEQTFTFYALLEDQPGHTPRVVVDFRDGKPEMFKNNEEAEALARVLRLAYCQSTYNVVYVDVTLKNHKR